MSMPSRAELKDNLKLLKERLTERPMDLDARMRIARTYRLLDEPKDAVAHYAAVARYLSLAGHPLQAVAVLKELLQVDPHHEASLLFLAKLYARTRAADPSNRGRVAVPILDDNDPLPGQNPLTDGVAMTTTGIWRAIRPTQLSELARVRTTDDVGAVVDAPSPLRAATAADAVPPALPSTAASSDDDDDEDDDELEPTGPLARPPAATVAAVAAAAAVDDADDGVDPEPSLDELDDDDVLALDDSLSFEESVLTKVPLFSSLDAGAFVALSHSMVLVRHRQGEALFREGDPGDSCFVLVKGAASVSRVAGDGDSVRDVVGPGDIVGLFALVRAEQRQATVVAESDVESLEIDRAAVAQVFARFPVAKDAFVELLGERIVDALFLELPGLAALDEAARAEVRARLGQQALAAGDEAFDAVDDARGLWVILDGELAVGEDGAAGVVGEPLRVGDWVVCGAAAGEPVGLTARARTPCRLATLDGAALAAAGGALQLVGHAARRATAVWAGTVRR